MQKHLHNCIMGQLSGEVAFQNVAVNRFWMFWEDLKLGVCIDNISDVWNAECGEKGWGGEHRMQDTPKYCADMFNISSIPRGNLNQV